MIIGALAAILLIVLMIQLKSDVNDQVKTNGSDNAIANEIKVTVNFTAWYYLSICSFLFAAFLSFKQNEMRGKRETPPKNAPQVPIHNPGEQSEFPTNLDESELER
jgi:hypothetical protein